MTNSTKFNKNNTMLKNMKNEPTKQQIKDYFRVWRKFGKVKANYLYENVFWYLWEKKLDFKWKQIWNKA